MPRASRKRINKKILEDLNDHFAYLISSLSNSKEIESFFNDFLTSEEKTMLTKRVMLHLMLENNYTTSQIESVLEVSRETVRVHKNIWSRGGEQYKRIIRQIAQREKTRIFWDKVERILRPVGLLMRSKTDMRARAKVISGNYD